MKKVILFVLIPVIILTGTAFGIYYYIQLKIYKPTKQEAIFNTVEGQKQASLQEERGVINILLVGLDGRTKDSDSRTDSMILATIDGTNKRVKLTSFMRDMYLPIPKHGQTRLNTAYFFGGSELLMKTLNQDFNLNVQYYMSIDFKAFQALVDKVGGIDVEVKDYEIKQLNYYIKEANWTNPHLLIQAGFQHLDGQQALSFCRIRKVGNNDYERTERQRRVLAAIISKMKKISIFKLPNIMVTLLPYLKTNIPTSKLLSMGYSVYSFGSVPVDTLRIPADGTYQGMIIGGADVLVPDLNRNIALLDRFFSSTGALGIDNLPAYMDNNYHASDEKIDKRGLVRKTIKIKIPKQIQKSAQYNESIDYGSDVVPQDIPQDNGSTDSSSGGTIATP